ncbi:MAG: hypothetical protein ACJ8KO_04420, partial [Sulfurifustaceae bacterium]
MLRLTEIKVPLNHAESELKTAILERLRIEDDELIGYSVARRGYDARRPAAIVFIYTLDVEVKNEAKLLQLLRGDRRVAPTPDMHYRFVANASAAPVPRPVVIGFGPCGLFAALVLAQMGFRPIVLERGKAVRERTQDTWGLWR